MSHLRLFTTFFTLGLIVFATHVQAVIITLPAALDTTVKSGSSTQSTNFNTQNLEVTRLSGSSNRSALFQFDLSSIAGAGFTINSAHIDLYDTATSTTQSAAFSGQTGYIIPIAGKTDAELTVNNGASNAGVLALDKNGMVETTFNYRSYSGAAIANNYNNINTPEMDVILGASNAAGYFSTGNASVSALAAFTAQKDSALPWLLFSVYGGPDTSVGSRIFSDREAASGTQAPLLVLDVTVAPEPSSFVLGALGVVGLCFISKRRKK